MRMGGFGKPAGRKGPIFFICGISALLAGGCGDPGRENDDIGGESSSYAIEFRQPRTTIMGVVTTEVADGGSFSVSGYLTDENGTYSDADPVLYDEQVVRKGNDYTYGNVAYWPSDIDKYIRFFAWYPYGAGQALAQDAAPPALSFRVADDVRAQVDLVYGATSPLNRLNGNPVRFTFRHALTRIRFAVRLTDDVPVGYRVHVRSIGISALNQATMFFPDSPVSDPEWRFGKESTVSYYDLTEEEGNLQNNRIVSSGASGNPSVNVLPEGCDLFLVPQAYSDAQKIYVSYRIENPYEESDPAYLYTDREVEIPLAAESGEGWKPGQFLTYTLNIGSLGASVVLQVGNWEEGNAGNEEIVME